MRILLGIDDTDNKESRGTGYNSRQLAAAVEDQNLGQVVGITRHQLLVHPDIPYTSQNSSACLDIYTDKLNDIKSFAREFMLNIGAVGSDVGLCIGTWDSVSSEIIAWGESAKSVVLNMDDASELAKTKGIYLEGLTGTHGGIIGALAATGLRKGGNDGRFIWLNSAKNLRDIENGIHTVDVLISESGIDIVKCNELIIDNADAKVYLNNWARPVLINQKSVLLVDKEINNKNYEWRCSAKEFVKRVSD